MAYDLPALSKDNARLIDEIVEALEATQPLLDALGPRLVLPGTDPEKDRLEHMYYVRRFLVLETVRAKVAEAIFALECKSPLLPSQEIGWTTDSDVLDRMAMFDRYIVRNWPTRAHRPNSHWIAELRRLEELLIAERDKGLRREVYHETDVKRFLTYLKELQTEPERKNRLGYARRAEKEGVNPYGKTSAEILEDMLARACPSSW